MLKSIPLKKFVQLMFLLAFPITINFFSPYLIVLGAWNGIVNGSLMLFAILLIGSIFFGRLFAQLFALEEL